MKIVASLAVWLTLYSANGQGLGANAKVCNLLPIADLETHYGAKSGPPMGMDTPRTSTCTVAVGENIIRLQASPPGTKGVPTTIQTELQAMTAMMPKNAADTKDFGKVGCFNQNIGQVAKPNAPKPRYSSTCFVVEDGYMTLTLSHHDQQRVSFDAVKQLTEKAAARRKP